MNTTLTKPKRLKNKNLVLLLILFFLSTAFSCKEDPPVIPPPPEPILTLTIDDVSCTEAWLNLKLENVTLPVDLELKRDSIVTKTFLSLNSNDTTLYVDSLLPNRTYNLQLTSNEHPVSSNELSITTMDTTSHNFTWQTFEFGQHSSSVLYDVAIIDENNIWAVGEIFMNDSLGNPDPIAYNAVFWDGSDWEIKKISVLYRGNLITPPLYGIFAFSANEIWLSSGVPIKGDGTNWQQFHLFDMGVLTQQDGYLTKIWCSSSADIYYVGTLGTIAHFNGSQWTKIESGTTLNINDIWGFKNADNETEIIITAAKFPLTRKFVVGKIINNTVVPIFLGNLTDTNPKHGLWFFNKHKYYLTGSSIHSKVNIDDNEEWIIEEPTLYFQECIRGTSYNNIFSAGHFGELYHFDGVKWKSLKMYSGITNGVFTSISIKPAITACCGSSNSKAVITIIK